MFQRRTARRFVPGREPGAAPTITAVRTEAECVPQSPWPPIRGSTSFCLRWLPNRCAGKRHGNTGRCPASPLLRCGIAGSIPALDSYSLCASNWHLPPLSPTLPPQSPWAEFSAGQRMQRIGALDRGYGSRGPWIRGRGFGAVGSRRCTRGVSTPHRYSTCRSWCCTGMEKKSNCLPDCRRSYQQTSLGDSAWVPLGTAHSVCGVVAMSSLAVAIRCLAEGGILAHNHLATSCTSFA